MGSSIHRLDGTIPSIFEPDDNRREWSTSTDSWTPCQGSKLAYTIEGGVNARLRAMLRNHRGLNIERRIKAAFWWCYMHSPEPLSAKKLLKVMPTDRSIAEIYKRLSPQKKVESSIPMWGDAIVWNELHRTTPYPELWSQHQLFLSA